MRDGLCLTTEKKTLFYRVSHPRCVPTLTRDTLMIEPPLDTASFQ